MWSGRKTFGKKTTVGSGKIGMESGSINGDSDQLPTSNFQFPTPNSDRSTERDESRAAWLARGTSTPLFGLLRLRVGSWRLGVGDCPPSMHRPRLLVHVIHQ